MLAVNLHLMTNRLCLRPMKAKQIGLCSTSSGLVVWVLLEDYEILASRCDHENTRKLAAGSKRVLQDSPGSDWQVLFCRQLGSVLRWQQLKHSSLASLSVWLPPQVPA